MRSDRSRAIQNRRIVGVGRLETEKGFDRLIDAFARIAESHQDWRLRILGEGSCRRQLETQRSRLGLDDRVSMPGWVDEIESELAAATIFALPSRYEGFPSALMEAMAIGVPSVAVDCESGPRVVINEPGCGLLVDNDVGALAEGMNRLIGDEEFREAIGRAGTSVLGRFAIDSMVEAYEQILEAATIPSRCE